MSDDGTGDASHERPSHPALSSTAHNYQARPYLLRQGNDLSRRAAYADVIAGDVSSSSRDESYPLSQQTSASVGNAFDNLLEFAARLGVRRRRDLADVHDVQLRAGLVGQFYRAAGCQLCIFGAVGGQQDPGRENANLLLLPDIL
jgi:hypothetical protein